MGRKRVKKIKLIPLTTGVCLIRKIVGTPKLVQIIDKEPMKATLIRVIGDGENKVLHASTIHKFYRKATKGEQAELFKKPVKKDLTVMDQLKAKHLRDGRG